MKTIYSIIAIFMFISFYGCTSYNVTEFYSGRIVKEKIPPIHLQEVFEVAPRKGSLYSFYQRDANTGKETLTPLGDRTEQENSYFNRTKDAFQIVEKEFNDNMCEPFGGKFFGRGSWRIVNVENSSSMWWIVPSALTAFAINFLGFPIASQSAEVNVGLEFFDSRDSLIAKYSASGEGSAYCAMYWGYSILTKDPAGTVKDDRDITRAAHARAVANAVQQIEEQVRRDASSLRKRLIDAVAK